MNINEVAPCGIDCVNCELYRGNNNQELWEKIAGMRGTTPDKVVCSGCREQGGCSFHPRCATLECIREKGLDFCGDCDDFPCLNLLPAREHAERLPHNMKVFNLCTIKRDGVESFLSRAPELRRRYFTGRMILGAGPRLGDEDPYKD